MLLCATPYTQEAEKINPCTNASGPAKSGVGRQAALFCYRFVLR